MIKVDFNIKSAIILFALEMIKLKKMKINNGVICISSNFVYSCPLSLDMDFNIVTLSLFYNDYIMKYRNMFKSRSLKKVVSSIDDETQAGLIASDYGYVIMQYKNNTGNIYLPEFYNSYQLCRTVEELDSKRDYNYNLYKHLDEDRDVLLGLNETDACDMVKSTFFDSYYDSEDNYIDYNSDNSAKTLRIIK